MAVKCPHCNQRIEFELDIKSRKPRPHLAGRELLNHLIEECGKKIIAIARETGITSTSLSNMRRGNVAIGHKRAIILGEYFKHDKWRDLITDRIKK